MVIAATWGEGDPPARAVRSYGEFMGEGAPRLDGIEFGVLALGDTAYAEFCAIGKKIDERLAALGAKRVVERVDCDLDFAKPAANGSPMRSRRWRRPIPNRGQGNGKLSKSISAASPRPRPIPILSKRKSPST